ncbi:MAG: UbiA family prenyltransferase [bacterium]
MFHPFPSLVVTAVTVAAAFLADSSPPMATVLELGLAMLCYQFAIGIANDLVDAADDKRLKPWKAIPRGIVGRRHALLLTAGLAGCGMMISVGLPFGAWLVGLAGLACGLAYDVQLKRTALSWLPFAVALPLIPVWVFLSLDRWQNLLWAAFPIGALIGLALHLANQAPDVPGEPHVRGLAHRLGTERAANLAVGVFGLAGIVGALVLVLNGAPMQALLIAATAMISGVMARRATTFGRDGLFGLLAASSAAVAVVFFSAL